MALQFDALRVEQIEDRLLGPGSDALIKFMFRKSLSLRIQDVELETVKAARDLGWISEHGTALTTAGRLAADSCREYVFWQERGGLLPFDNAAPHLSTAYFRGRAVLEVGCGMGSNLLSLAEEVAEISGLEPIIAYTQMGTIFQKREGRPPVDIRAGVAENMPFDDNSVDIILCVSAHQYFDIHRAFAEFARILRPGGELIIIGGTLKTYAMYELGELTRGIGPAKAYVITVLNTLSYMMVGRRIASSKARATTTRPIYPTRAAMRRWLQAYGLSEITPPCWVGEGGETCFHFGLPA